MDLDLQYTRDKYHSDKESLMRNLRRQDLTQLDVGASNYEICEDDSDCISTKSCCGDSTQKTTQSRPTLRELLQLPADCGSPSEAMSQSKTFQHSEHQTEQKQLEKQKSVSKQYKWWGVLKTKGISWSSLLKPEERNKKAQRKNENGVFGKVTNSAERTKLLNASDHIG
uniref:uncharacterized protein LOC105353476 n=1 Tax=Fragaria vesca subsp. vesca TaxID=101020 RepID=UPI0005CA219D|nr:PREDICTED: uncharacterized protein LOC105353476 [Fragaria vesca subsp. vesca]